MSRIGKDQPLFLLDNLLWIPGQSPAEFRVKVRHLIDPRLHGRRGDREWSQPLSQCEVRFLTEFQRCNIGGDADVLRRNDPSPVVVAFEFGGSPSRQTVRLAPIYTAQRPVG